MIKAYIHKDMKKPPFNVWREDWARAVGVENYRPVCILEVEQVEEVVKLLHSISFPLDEWPKLKKALAILERGEE